MINANEKLDLIEAELESCYQRLGIIKSNVSDFIPEIKNQVPEVLDRVRQMAHDSPKFNDDSFCELVNIINKIKAEL